MPLLPHLHVAVAAILLAAAVPAAADPREIGEDERVIGRADAPVTIIEYASLTCPACARFHIEVLPQLNESYVETGDARIVYRDFPLDRLALAAAILARCVEPGERSLAALGLLYNDQEAWSRAEEPLPALVDTLAPLGVDMETAEACFAREDLARDVLSTAKAGYDAFDIGGTPSFVIDGELVPRLFTFDDFEQALEPLLAR
jgi:protein-disulfide isomerase